MTFVYGAWLKVENVNSEIKSQLNTGTVSRHRIPEVRKYFPQIIKILLTTRNFFSIPSSIVLGRAVLAVPGAGRRADG